MAVQFLAFMTAFYPERRIKLLRGTSPNLKICGEEYTARNFEELTGLLAYF